jgi:hypothetical protein
MNTCVAAQYEPIGPAAVAVAMWEPRVQNQFKHLTMDS